MVDGENLATVHLDEAAEWQLSVLDPHLLGRLEGDALQTVTPVQGPSHAALEGSFNTRLPCGGYGQPVLLSHRLY